MANHLHQLLEHWYPQRDELQWVLATIVGTDGSSYRKTGAMMMISSLGRYHGLLSGGCLESDIMRQSRRCWDSGENVTVVYDMREEEDLAWQLGIGCGGMVRILLQPVSRQNSYLSLHEVREAVNRGHSCHYRQRLAQGQPQNYFREGDSQGYFNAHQQVQTVDDWIEHHMSPPPHLAIFGGGVDARPLVAIAATLGWRVTLIDPRVGYARDGEFPGASTIIRSPLAELGQAGFLSKIDVAMVMNHNVSLDAAALQLVQSSTARYSGLLGPGHRTQRVLDEANLSLEDLQVPLSNPAGLRLGGELPESIALSVMAEFHALLEQADGLSISGILSQ